MVFIDEEIVHTLDERITHSILSNLTANIFQCYLQCVYDIAEFSRNGLRKVSLCSLLTEMKLELSIKFIEMVLKNFVKGTATVVLERLNDAFENIPIIETGKTKGLLLVFLLQYRKFAKQTNT